ncbi:DUF7546 family protein [Halegenticoccus tardaugens]|uniref:DUF7546 family protein n=1 Tax=Halegenticoccus tardaugens TaxID=2071624 RepID=UPI00100A6913|nr:hypothetical protein [Halegenticoccus tardaugens]
MSTVTATGLRPTRETLLYGGLLLNSVVLLTLAYVLFTEGSIEPLRYTVYGLLWVLVGAWAILRTDVAPAGRATKRKAAAVAAGYFVALAVAGGLVAGAGHVATGFRIAWLPPGWGPALVYAGESVNLVLMPARVVGYVALAYLVYATVVDAAGAAVSGVLGLLSCVSCSWPIIASVATGVFGSGTALAASATALSYDLSTAVFLVTVALLYWRPFGR